MHDVAARFRGDGYVAAKLGLEIKFSVQFLLCAKRSLTSIPALRSTTERLELFIEVNSF